MGSLIKLYGFGYKKNTFAASSSIFDKNIKNTFAAVALTSIADLTGQKHKQACFCPSQISILSAAKKNKKNNMPFFHINPQIFAVKEKQYAIFSIFLQISIEKTFKKIMVLSI
ncbi:MAG: hypothetical protein CW341_01980 [Bacteroidetes bacterium]|nr:hypothetical protein [Bacteroidota bacterium]